VTSLAYRSDAAGRRVRIATVFSKNMFFVVVCNMLLCTPNILFYNIRNLTLNRIHFTVMHELIFVCI
jgi:hypothetical protein